MKHNGKFIFFTLAVCFASSLMLSCGKKDNASLPGGGGNGGSKNPAVFQPGSYPTHITCSQPLYSVSVANYINTVKTDYCVHDSECRSEGIGHKACGGSIYILTYSLRAPSHDLWNMHNAIDYYNWRTWRENDVCQLVSDCAFLSLPDRTRCINSKCTAIYD